MRLKPDRANTEGDVMDAAIPQPAMHGETVVGPTQSGRVAPVTIEASEQHDQWTPKPEVNANILGKLAAPVAGGIFLFIMALMWKMNDQTQQQIASSQAQIEKFYEQTKEQHSLDRTNMSEQRSEDRKVRREELVEQKSLNERTFQFMRDIQLILVEDSAAIRALKTDNKATVDAVRLNQLTIIGLQRDLVKEKKTLAKPMEDDDAP